MIEVPTPDPPTLSALLRTLTRIRRVEETIAQRYAEGRMRCPTHLCSGQEAVAAAAGCVLRPDDYAVSSHRGHGHYLAKGGNLNRMIAEIYGKAGGCSGGKGGSMHLVDVGAGFMGCTAIVGGTIPVAVGLALSCALKASSRISCAFFGDGSTEEGVFYEAVNFAVLKRLPVLFICENNLYSVYSPLRVRQPAGRRIHEVAAALGCAASQADGNDAIAVWRQVAAAAAAARHGGGPQFLEFYTYRWREHCGPNFDNDIGYRTEEEYRSWRAKDPLPRLQSFMIECGATTPDAITALERKIDTEIAAAFAFAEGSPFPPTAEAMRGLYRE